MNETIKWIDVNVELPDDGTTVLVHIPEANSERVWLGYLDEDEWITVDAMPFTNRVTHWAELPSGPIG